MEVNIQPEHKIGKRGGRDRALSVCVGMWRLFLDKPWTVFYAYSRRGLFPREKHLVHGKSIHLVISGTELLHTHFQLSPGGFCFHLQQQTATTNCAYYVRSLDTIRCTP